MIQPNTRVATLGGLLLVCGVASGLVFAFSTPTRMKGMDQANAVGADALTSDWAMGDSGSTIPYEAPPIDLAPPAWQPGEDTAYYSRWQDGASATTIDDSVLNAGLADSSEETLPPEIMADLAPEPDTASLDRSDAAAASAQAASEAAADVTAAIGTAAPANAPSTAADPIVTG